MTEQKNSEEQSQMEGPAAYAPHDKDEKKPLQPKSNDKSSKPVGGGGRRQ
jgi:hypothetical protein